MRRSRSPNPSIGLALAIGGILIAGCQAPTNELPSSGDGGVSPGSPGESAQACTVPFKKVIEPLRVQGWKHLYFSTADFAFLSDSDVLVNDVSLVVQIRGKRKSSDGEIILDTNGVAITPKPGAKPVHHEEQPSQDFTIVRVKMNQMKLNAATTFIAFLFDIFGRDGSVKISLSGKSTDVVSARLEFSGVKLSQCTEPSPTPTSTATSSPSPTPTATASPSPTPTPTVVIPAPETRIDSVTPADALTTQSSVSFAFSSDQGGVTFYCSIDRSAAAPCSSPASYSGLESGVHEFAVFARNTAGLSDDTPAAYAWTVDTIAPEVVLDPVPALTNATSLSVNFAAADADRFLCSVDGSAYAACASPLQLVNLSEGDHRIEILAVDAAGNRSEAPAVALFRTDYSGPVVSIAYASPAESPSSADHREIGFEASETASFECSLDGAAFAACTSPVQLSALAEGQHTLAVRAQDLAGNLGGEASHAFLVDLTEPVLTVGTVNPAPGVTNASQVSAEFWADEIARFECSWDEAEFTPCASPFVAAVQVEGAHRLAVRAVDAAGNASAAQVLDWTFDFQAPLLSFARLEPSKAYLAVDHLDAEIAVSEAVVTLQATLDGSPVDVSNGLVSLTGLAEGAHRLEVTGIDAAGNAGAAIAHEFTVDLTAPALTLTAAITGETNQTSNRFDFHADEEASYECDFNQLGFAACDSPFLVSGLVSGQHELKVRAIDLAGNVSAVSTSSWEIDLVAPVVSVTWRQEGSDLVFLLDSNEADTTYECSLDGAALAPCSSPVRYSGLASGEHSFFVRGTDAFGNLDSAGVAVTAVLDKTPPVPSTPTYTVTRTSITLSWTTNEPSTSQAYYAVGSNATPNKATVETTAYVTSHRVTISGLVNNTFYSIQVSGRDAMGNRFFSSKVVVKTAQ